jgi:Transcription factor WhiB
MSRNIGLPGRGPWRIDPRCPAFSHNTAFAAKKGGLVPHAPEVGRIKCICPRAIAAYKAEQKLAELRKIERGDRKTALGGRPRGAGMEYGIPQYYRNVVQNVAVPDLGAGLCRTPLGMEIMDLAQAKRWTGETLEKAKTMCDGCPVQFKCGQWATDAESPAGDWSGIYGGLTHMERRDAAKPTAEQATEMKAA